MAKIVMVIGKSGAGKSASMRNIPNDLYSLIEVIGKPLPFRTNKKFFTSDSYADISAYINNPKAKDIIIIDDSQYLMADEFMNRAKEKGYEKYSELGVNFWNLIREAAKLPDEKIVYFLHHSETDNDGNSKEKTIGKMLDEKINIAGMFSIVLFADKSDKEYFFATQSNGKTIAKTPMGMFDKLYIDNDLFAVDKAIRDYYGMAPLVSEPEKETPATPNDEGGKP